MQFWLLKCYRNFVVRRHGVYRLMIFVSHWVFVFRLFIYQTCTHFEITALYSFIYVLFVLSRDKNKLVVFLMEEIYRFLYIMLSRILFPRRKSTLSLTGPLPVCFLFSETTKINHVTCLQNILHSIVCFIWKLINIVCCGSFVL